MKKTRMATKHLIAPTLMALGKAMTPYFENGWKKESEPRLVDGKFVVVMVKHFEADIDR